MFEEQMGERIITFMEEEGYAAYPQIPLFLGKIDFVGINRDSEFLVVESKVSNWKKALKQALRYGYGAEKAYVALPTPTAKNVERRHRVAFERYKVGLIEVSKDVSILISCKTKTPSLIFKRIILSEIQKRKARSLERIAKFKEKCKE